MKQLIDKLKSQFPDLRFATGDRFSWSPKTGEIIYKRGAKGRQAEWSLLHEAGHALLDHQSYGGDFELLQMEIDAWQRSKTVAKAVNIEISEDHIQGCLDTYRDWLYKRSICPSCGNKCLQEDNTNRYRCFNCHASWQVTSSRFGRAYRRSTVSAESFL